MQPLSYAALQLYHTPAIHTQAVPIPKLCNPSCYETASNATSLLCKTPIQHPAMQTLSAPPIHVTPQGNFQSMQTPDPAAFPFL